MTPDPWLTFWIAVSGAFAALLSGVGSIWALTQKRRYLPKPLMVRGTRREQVRTLYDQYSKKTWGGYEVLKFVATNKGNGIAHDVRLVLHGPSGPTTETNSANELQHGGSIAVAIAVSTKAEEYDGRGNSQLASEGADPSKFWAELKWRQAPNMKRVHRRKLRER